jgi:adenine-specific DNA-methyltransferase
MLGNICYISYGLRPNSDERFWKGEFTRDDLISEIKDRIHPKAYVEGKCIKKYAIEKKMYLEWGTDRVPKKLVVPHSQNFMCILKS